MRNNLKRTLMAILTLIMVLSFGIMFACGNDSGSNTAPTVSLTIDRTTASLEVGKTLTLHATLKGSTEPIEWSSSDTSKATVYGGVVIGVEAGLVTITANAGELTATCMVTVTAKLTLDKTNASIEAGDTITLNATLIGGSDVIEWISSDTSVATVNNGEVISVGAGFVTITARAGGVFATCDITVTEVKNDIIPVISLNNSSTQIYRNQPLDLHASVSFNGKKVTDATVVYGSTDESVVNVSEAGVVTGLKKGSAVVTANCSYKGRIATQRSIKISVVDLTIVAITNENLDSVKTGESVVLNATVSSNGVEITDPDIVYSVSDPNAASISGNVLTAIREAQNLRVIATYMDGGEAYTDTIEITIESSVLSSGALVLSPNGNEGEIFIETDKTIVSATMGGSEITFIADEGGYNIDISLCDVNNAEQNIILTDSDGIAHSVVIYTIVQEIAEDIVVARSEEAYRGIVESNVKAYGRTGVIHAYGQSYDSPWQNSFMMSYKSYLAKGYNYMAFDLVFVPGSENRMGFLGVDGTYYYFNVGSAIEYDEFALYDLNGKKADFAASTWQTVVVDLTNYGGNLEFYSPDGFHAYIDNVRFMATDAYDCFVNGKVYDTSVGAEGVTKIALANAIVNSDTGYTLTRAAAVETYKDKRAIRFKGANQELWRNNLLIDIKDYKENNKWILVDFYFNSDDVEFEVLGSVNGYAAMAFGSHQKNGSYYVIRDGGDYSSLPAEKGQWITVAFKIEDISGDYISGRMSGAVNTYVANIRAVTDSVLDEIFIPGIVKNTDIVVSVYDNTIKLTREDNVTFYGRTGLVRMIGHPYGTWQNQWNLNGLNDLKIAGFKYLAIDILFQTQGVSDCMPRLYIMANPINTPIGGNPDDSALRIFNAAHSETTLSDNCWYTYVIDLEACENDWLGFFASGASEWYVDTIVPMTDADFVAFQVKPEKVDIASNAWVNTNITATSADNIGGRDDVTLLTSNDVLWYNNFVVLNTTQYENAGYDTFSFDLYLTSGATLYFYYYDTETPSSIANGAVSGIDGIRLLDANGDETALAANTWLTVKVDLLKTTCIVLYVFQSDTSAMYFDNCYFENAN